MISKLMRPIAALIATPWIRILLAAGLLLVGLAPIGVPILSESSWRQPATPAQAAVAAQPFVYDWNVAADGTTHVRRSDDGGKSWHEVAGIPQTVKELTAVRGDEQEIFARSDTAIWVSQDGGSTWERSTLPSRPMAMAVSNNTPGLVFAGTESLGLLRSNDSGAHWQPVDSGVLAGGGAGPLSVSALAINPDDEQIVYAASGLWLGTSQVRFSPLGVSVSVDGGRHWLQMAQAALDDSLVKALRPVAGKPLSVWVIDASGSHAVEMKLTSEMLAMLDDTDPGVRASAARVIGLLGDRSALPVLASHLRDTNPIAGQEIAVAIGRMNDNSAVPQLQAALGSKDEAVRARAATALGMLRVEPAVPALAQMLRSDGPLAQRSAAEALAAIATPDAVSALMAPLRDAELTSARQAAMAGLEQAGQVAAAPLAAALADKDAVVRRNAAELLGYLRPASATDQLALAINDPDPTVRTEAAWALGELGTPQAQRALAQSLAAEKDAATRDATRSALARAESLAGSQAPAGSPGESLISALSEIPASRWTFLALFAVLAGAILLLGPRERQTGRVARR